MPTKGCVGSPPACSAPRERVVHPLDDEPEAKFDPDALGPMHMSASVKISLFLLRLYSFAMIALVAYRVLEAKGRR